MHLVKRSPVPQKLKEIDREETPKWVDYYLNAKSTKPGSRWRIPEILNDLVDDFEDNCGYCGICPFTHSTGEKEKKLGEVDHFYPISKRPDLAYEWGNLIWSCSECNSFKVKGDYYNPDHSIFHPCKKEDVEVLVLREDGKYYLLHEWEGDPVLKKRYQATIENTNINSFPNFHNRKALINDIIITLNNFREKTDYIQSPKFSSLDEEIQAYIHREFKQDKERIQYFLNHPNYKKMIRFVMEKHLSSLKWDKEKLTEMIA